ncbi:hypothetical protein ISS04_01675 [Candidatus Woesearchaeota archaeon]|nr:hypothetical protein [Candidatus Woesearchaeota archaeon]
MKKYLLFLLTIIFITIVSADQPEIDLAIINLESSNNSNNFTFTSTILNLGNQTTTNTTLFFIIDNQTHSNHTIPELIQDQTINILSFWINATNGTHTIKAIINKSDYNISNNNRTIIINITIPPTNQSNQSNQSGDTPQTPNKDIWIEVNLDEPVYLNVEYDRLFKITNLDHISGQTDQINITTHYNLTKDNNIIKQAQFNSTINSYTTSNTGTIIFNSSGNHTLCGKIINSSNQDNNSENNIDCKTILAIDTTNNPCNISINLSVEKTIYNNQEQIVYHNTLTNDSIPFTIEYWIEDLFGTIVKSKTNTTNLNQKTYTPNIDGTEKVLLIKNRLLSLACNNFGNTESEKLIAVINNITLDEESYINIQDISPSSINFGETIRAEIEVYKGNTLKKVLEAWVEGADGTKITSANSKITLNEKYTQYSFTMPLQLKPNCDEDFNDGSYILHIEGLSISDQKVISVSGKTDNLCEIEYIENSNNDCSCPTQTCQQTKTTQTLSEGGFYYSLNFFQTEIQNNKSFTTTINLTNNDNQPHNISIWSYIYRHTTSYSGERTGNLKTLTLPPNISILLNLTNTITNTEPGDYKLKVKINKDNQATNKEITKEILVTPTQSTEINQLNNNNITQTNNLSYQNTAHILPTGMTTINSTKVVFQSPITKLKKYFVYLISFLFIFGIVLFFRIK